MQSVIMNSCIFSCNVMYEGNAVVGGGGAVCSFDLSF
jgi:hypothetical protein